MIKQATGYREFVFNLIARLSLCRNIADEWRATWFQEAPQRSLLLILHFQTVCHSLSRPLYTSFSSPSMQIPVKSHIDLSLLQLRITSASPGKVNFELDIQKHHTNRLGILHGGTIASMVDAGGSLALASRGLYSTGVSTDLNVTYLNSGGKIGDTLRGEVVCDKCTYRSEKKDNG
jgi:uncharacterized protein (TIGR00369 family)